MKILRNIKYIIVISVLLSVFSCNIDDIGTPGLNPADTSVVDIPTLKSAVNSVYSSLNPKQEISFVTVFTDEVGKGFGNGGQGTGDPSYGFIINTGDFTVRTIWQGYISMVNYANRAIDGGEKLTTESDADEATRKDLIAQAKALRAYAYLQLMAYFSPDLTDVNAKGPIFFTESPSTKQGIARGNNGQIYDLIYQDLDYADQNLSNATGNYLVSKAFAKALRIRTDAYKGSYGQIEAMVDSNFPASNLVSGDAYKAIWNADSPNSEIIFEAQRSVGGVFDNQANWVGNCWASVNATLDGSPFFEMGRSLYNEYAMHPSDVRLSSFLSGTSVIDPNYQTSGDYLNSDKLIVAKYPGKDGANKPLMNDIKIFRVSEMQLLKAEAQIANDKLIAAAQTIKAVRDARGTGEALQTYASKEQAYADLLKERRKELAFEGFRYVDVKRLGKKANVSFVRDAKDAELFAAPVTLDVNSNLLTLPIPQDEINGNEALTSADQNPGY